MTKEQAVVKKLLDTIVATGGLIRYPDGSHGCAADEEWLDLADTALLAQDVLQISGIIVEIPIANASEAELLPSDAGVGCLREGDRRTPPRAARRIRRALSER
jgi:hypothetical protein